MAATDHRQRRLRAAGLALLVGWFATGCDPAPPEPGPGPGTTPPPSGSPSTDPGHDLAVDETDYPESAQEYAELTVAAWAAPDLFRLAELATGQVQDDLLDLAGPPDLTWRFTGCRPVEDSSDCGFYNSDGDQLVVTITHQRLGSAQAATGTDYQPIRYPQEPLAYVAEFITAWQVGNRARMAGLAAPEAVAVVAGLPTDAEVDYQLDESTDTVATVLITVDGQELTATLSRARLGGPQAIGTIESLA